MQLSLKHITLLTSLCAAIAACSDQDVFDDNITNGKTPIELSVGGVDAPALTRAVVTDGTTNTTFGRDTKVFLLMQSEKDATAHGGYEYQGDRANTLTTVSRGDVVHDTDPSAIVFDDVNKKYWDDAHARSSQLTLWAVAQRIANPLVDGTWKSITFQKINGSDPMTSENTRDTYNTTSRNEFQSEKNVYPVIYTWNVGNPAQNQDGNTLIYQDLLYSNNIANYEGNTKVPESSKKDNRLKFDFDTHKFPTNTELKFYHAMSKITIQIKAGDGFKADGTDFELKTNSAGVKTVDMLSGLNTSGLFNIKDGEFQMIHNSADITSIPLTKTVAGKSEPYYTLEALAIPNIHQFLKVQTPAGVDENSRFLDGSDVVMLQFTIDNNTYMITSDALFDAVTGKQNATTLNDNGTYVPLEAGKNYVFTFTISKTKISGITAQVLEWETVTANNYDASNARISLMLEERGNYVNTDVDFYRAKDTGNSAISDSYKGYNWATGYNTDGKATETTCTSNKWKTPNWYWPDNTTFYHFRALSPTSQTITTAANDYTSLTAGESYTDVRWGAPMLDDKDDDEKGNFKFYYNTTKGFDATGTGSPNASHQIYHGIGPTNADIKLLMFHMMSDVTINVKTLDEDDPAKVDLGDGTGTNVTKIAFENIYTTGSVAMGNGLVSTTGSVSNYTFTATPAPIDGVIAWKNYGAIPQSLENVVLVITTPDKNEYRVSMKEVVATVPTYINVSYPAYTANKVNYWYPGVQYTYTFKLSKKKIEDITATILDWENVTAWDDNVQIK